MMLAALGGALAVGLLIGVVWLEEVVARAEDKADGRES